MFDLPDFESERPSRRHEQLMSDRERDSAVSIISIFVIGIFIMLMLTVIELWK